MRVKPKLKKPSPEKPVRTSGSKKAYIPHDSFHASRPHVKVGAPDTSWSDAKWLALADQALSE